MTTVQTVQITVGSESASPSLKVHEDRGDGTPVCGRPLRDWHGLPSKYTQQGKGVVTCGLCLRTTRRGSA